MNRLLYAVAWIVSLGSTNAACDARGNEPAGKYALLIGCTRYSNLPESLQLKGPGNDVQLMKELLVGRFGFSSDSIVVLSESAGRDDTRPTRANIKYEFVRLAKVAKKGDQVVILLAGHGSQQPDQEPPDPGDAEPDGLDEIFLPADVGRWDGDQGQVANAIVDDELRAWLKEIQQRGAEVWIIIDACHSGTMCRGNDDEVTRRTPPDMLTPESILQEARRRAAGRAARSRGEEDATMLKLPRQVAGLTALYAAQSHELTVEKSLPAGSPDRKRYGLLTYSLCQILTESDAPLTYHELIDQIHSQYARWGRTFPTPLVEGADRDREVLGVRRWPGRSQIVLTAVDDKPLINAGALVGLGSGTILSVCPPLGAANRDRPVGYVRIAECRMLDSFVEPITYGGLPANREPLMLGSVCEVAVVDYGDLRLQVAIDPRDHVGRPIDEPARQALDQAVRTACAASPLLVATREQGEANWLVRRHEGRTYLVPTSGVLSQTDATSLPEVLGPAPEGAGFVPWIEERLGRIVRASNLVNLASTPLENASDSGGVGVELKVRQLEGPLDRQGALVSGEGRGIVLYDNDYLSIEMHNPNRFAIDLTVLFIDSGYGIEPMFPRAGEFNRLEPDQTQAVRVQVTGTTTGREQLVAIAVKSGLGQPADFSLLSQPTIERARNSERQRGGDGGAFDSPLGRLLQLAMYGEGKTRSLPRQNFDEYAIRLITWQVNSQPRPSKRER